MSSLVSVSVVITASADRIRHLDRTLRSLALQRRPPGEVVVVQLGPEPVRPMGIDGLRVDVVSSEVTETGLVLGAARNLGAETSVGRRLVFLDVDCLAAADLVERYEDVLTAHPTVLACGPVRYLQEGWHENGTDRRVEDLFAAGDHHPARPRLDDERGVHVNDQHELFWSLSFGVARDTWTTLGGFDERFIGYGAEDTDLALRARALGVRMGWFGGGVALHQWHPATRLDPARTGEIVRNARLFRDRWGSWPMTGWLRELNDLGRIEFDESADHLRLVDP